MFTNKYDNGVVITVEDFYPGADAWVKEEDNHKYKYRVSEVVKYYGEPTEDDIGAINDIEDFGYDWTCEFITDDACYFVALTSADKFDHEDCELPFTEPEELLSEIEF